MPNAFLNPKNGYLFRITHVDNVRWILAHGLRCRNSTTLDADFVQIGNPEIIAERVRRSVPLSPRGTLADYVPFYFTPFSPMAYNIATGYGVKHVPREEIAILVASIRDLVKLGTRVLFTDRHAFLKTAQFFDSVDDLAQIDWKLLQRQDFRHDIKDPGKMERYQAEALVHRHLPTDRLRAILCYSEHQQSRMAGWATEAECPVSITTARRLYF